MAKTGHGILQLRVCQRPDKASRRAADRATKTLIFLERGLIKVEQMINGPISEPRYSW